MVGNWEDAKEMAQNGFVKAYFSLRRFRGEAKFSTWLYRIIANECKDLFRKKGRGPQLLSLSAEREPGSEDGVPFELADPGADPRAQASARELAGRLCQAVEELPGKQRTAFTLHHFSGLPVEEISRVMGCRPATVKVHLFRAAERLRALP